jgi:hypothetical protein
MLRSRQHEWMDECQLPWVFDRDLGPILAGRPTGDGGDVGDGAYVYRAGCEAPQPTTTPERAERLFAERERKHAEAVARLAIAAQAETGKETVARKAPLEEDPELASCTIQRRARPGGGRADVTIVTPDGRRFRSKAAALRHLSDLSTLGR